MTAEKFTYFSSSGAYNQAPFFGFPVQESWSTSEKIRVNYTPFGVTLKGRNLKKTGLADEFRFGFNGMEADDEMKGDVNSYDFGARMYDNRLGRFLSIDPFADKYPSISNYSNSLNNPIYNYDHGGNYVVPADCRTEFLLTNMIYQQVGYNKVADMLVTHLGLYTEANAIDHKEFKKALRKAHLKGEQREFAKLWYESIASTETVVVHGIEMENGRALNAKENSDQVARDQINSNTSAQAETNFELTSDAVDNTNGASDVSIQFNSGGKNGGFAETGFNDKYSEKQNVGTFGSNIWFTQDDGGEVNPYDGIFTVRADLVLFTVDVKSQMVVTDNSTTPPTQVASRNPLDKQKSFTLHDHYKMILLRISKATSNKPGTVNVTNTSGETTNNGGTNVQR